MKWLKAIIGWIGMVLAGMKGGQGPKEVRRFGLPALAIGTGWSLGWSWKYLAFLLFIPVLAMGYGVDSVLGAWVGHIEWLIRAVYALLLGAPFFVFGLWRGVWACVLLVVAFQVQAGSFGHVAWFGDILKEDIIRYGVLASLVIFNIVKKR